jgi:nucleoside-diphosphate-sugar epimerase
MKIVILGGSGYLATSICFYLKKKNKITLVTRNKKKINYKFRDVQIKETNYLSLKSLVKIFEKKDLVFHLIGANSEFTKKNKKKTLDFKKKSTKVILEAAKATNTKIIYFSTAQVYKNINKSNVNEDSKIEKRNQYVINHLAAENLILNDIKKNKSEHKIIRLSSVYGLPFFYKSKETFKLIINSLCLQAIKEKKIIIHDSSVIRNFIPISMFKELNKCLFLKKNNILNFGYKTIPLIDIAKIIQNICLKSFKINPKIISKPNIKKRKLPTYQSKFFSIKKKKEIIVNEISNLLKLIYKNA